MFLFWLFVILRELLTVQGEPVAILFNGINNISLVDTIEYYYPQNPDNNIISGRRTVQKMTSNFAVLFNNKKPTIMYGGGLGPLGKIFGNTMYINPYLILRQKAGPRFISGRGAFGYALIENFGLLVCGGFGFDGAGRWTTLKTCERYNEYKNEFVSVVSLPMKLSAFRMVSYEGKAYLFGGFLVKGMSKKVFLFDPHESEHKWKHITDMPFQRKWFGSALIKHTIYTCGGWTTEVNISFVPLCNAYNVKSNHWEAIYGPLRTYRRNHAMLAINEKLYMFGGYDIVGIGLPPLDTVLSYDPKWNKWKYEHKLIAPSSDAAAIVLQLPPPD